MEKIKAEKEATKKIPETDNWDNKLEALKNKFK
jgi:hypothetical protein